MSDMTVNISASLDSLLREFDIVTHNIANASTTGYKRQFSNFDGAIGSQVHATSDPDGTDEFLPVFDFSQGPLTQTGRNLDLALFGKGFFVIETPDGPLYTRNGMLHINQGGQVVDAAGRLVGGESGPLVIPAGIDGAQVSVGSDGTLYAGDISIGRLRIVCFPDAEDQLLPAGWNCWRAPTDRLPVVADERIVKQGYLEGSNVTLVNELVNMIMVTRAYEANVKLKNASSDATSSLLGVAMG